MVPSTGTTFVIFSSREAICQQRQHFRLDVHGVDATGRSDFWGDSPHVIACACADVRDEIAGADLERINQQ